MNGLIRAAHINHAPIGQKWYDQLRHSCERRLVIKRGCQQGASVGQKTMRILATFALRDIMQHEHLAADLAAPIEQWRAMDIVVPLARRRADGNLDPRLDGGVRKFE